MNTLLRIGMLVAILGAVAWIVVSIIDANRNRVLNKLRRRTDEERNRA